MAKDMENPMMWLFAILFLIMGLGLWSGAPAWWNLYTLIGLFFLLKALLPMMKG
ncbi:MAG: hypothetical protein V1776_02125 [Candidatus Diapherotrites archaeon]